MYRSTLRRIAGVVLVLALLLVAASAYVALVYHGDVSEGAETVVELATFENWILFFAVLLGIMFLILLVLLFVPTQERLPGAAQDVTIRCDNCQNEYLITDTGERPLYHTCPHCNTTHVLEAPGAAEPAPITPPEPSVWSEGAPPAAAETITAEAEPLPATLEEPQVVEREVGGVLEKFLVLHCTNCDTNFETHYTTERPLVTTCTNCGRRGVLRAMVAAPAEGRAVIDIEGIGPTYSKKLGEIGITTTGQLRSADPETVASSLDVPATTVRQWQAMAELMDVKGIGPQYSELLVKSGVNGVDDLKEADPEELLAKIEATNADRDVRITGGRVGLKTVQNWIRAAKRARAHASGA